MLTINPSTNPVQTINCLAFFRFLIHYCLAFFRFLTHQIHVFKRLCSSCFSALYIIIIIESSVLSDRVSLRVQFSLHPQNRVVVRVLFLSSTPAIEIA